MCALAGADQGERRFVSIYRKATQTGGVRDEEDEEIVTSEQLQSAEVALQAERARVRRRDRNFRTRASRKGTGPLSLRAIDCLHFVYYSHGKKQMREKVGLMMMFTTSLETIEQLPEVKQRKEKRHKWKARVSIPVPLAC